MLETTDRGSGPGVLLIHGAGPDATMWDDVAADLAADHRVVAYNRRGYPGSGEPVGDWNVHIEDAIGLIQDKGLAPATLVGQSAGTIVAAGVAAKRPDLVARVVLFDPIIHGQKRVTFKLIRTVMKVQRLKKKDPEAAVELFCRWATTYDGTSDSAYDHMSPEAQAAMRSRHAAVFADMDAGDGSKQLSKDELGSLTNTTIAVSDKTDRWFAKSSAALAKRIPTATVVSVENAGHAAALDNPKRVAEIIRTA